VTAPLGILHLTTFLQGGAGRAITDLACAQHAAGHRVTVVTSETGKGDFANYAEYLQRLRAAGVALHLCDSLFARDTVVNNHVVDLLCRSVDVRALDIIHAHAAVPAVIGRRFVSRTSRAVPIIQTQHGGGTNKTAEQAAHDIGVLARVSRVITTSRATADLLVSCGAPAAAMSVIPCGLPVGLETEPPAEAVRLVQGLRGDGARVVGCIGSVTRNKNQRLVIEALPLLADLNVSLVLVGEGGETLDVYARTRGVADRVRAVGYQSAAAAWMPLFDLLAVPSRTEGQGLVVLEAFRAGVPVVASRIPALSELIDDGENGFLFEGNDPRALSDTMRRVLALSSADRDAVVTGARRCFAARFTTAEMVARHERVYREVIGGRRRELQCPGDVGQQLDPAADHRFEVVLEDIGDRQPVI
jgi:L-malate glycosyltransferase